MNQNAAKRSSLFLLELIVAILFFALASAVCVQVYVSARVKSREASALTHAVLVCQNGAEVLYYNMDGENVLDRLTEKHPEYSRAENSALAYFNKEWKPCVKADAAYLLTLTATGTDAFFEGAAQITDIEANTPLYSLPVARQLP